MYIRRIIDKNIGPIEKIDLSFAFGDEGNPKPLVLVGQNGSGKSIFLSHIVDAFFEMADKAFDNACAGSKGGGHQYYKAISSSQIAIGKEYMYSYISFDDEGLINYIFKAGHLSKEKFDEESGCVLEDSLSWGKENNYKNEELIKI